MERMRNSRRRRRRRGGSDDEDETEEKKKSKKRTTENNYPDQDTTVNRTSIRARQEPSSLKTGETKRAQQPAPEELPAAERPKTDRKPAVKKEIKT